MSLVFYETHPPTKVSIIILEYTISKHVKLLDCLSDPHKPLINQISSGSSPAASSGPVDNCFICVRVHSFPICVPSFCKKGKTLKTKHQLLRKLRQKWNLCEHYMNRTTCTHMYKSIHTTGDHHRDFCLLVWKNSTKSNCLPIPTNHTPFFLHLRHPHQSILPWGLTIWDSTLRS